MVWLVQWNYRTQMNCIMTKINLLTIAVVTLLVLNLCIVGFLFFQKPHLEDDRHPPFGHKTPKDEIIEMLHFDNEQVAHYELLIHKHRTSIRDLDDNIQNTKSELYQTLQTENGSKKDSLINQLASLQKKIEETHLEHFIEIKKLCKPNQLDDFNELTMHLAGFFSHDKPGQRPPGQ